MARRELLVNSDPKSMFSESIKTFKTNLEFVKKKKDKILLFTSPEPGDGKSFVVANTAAAYAQEDKKVLIIDCDLRKGRQHEIFGVHNIASKGFSNLILNCLEENADIQNYIMNTDNENIDVIPRGAVPPNPVEILNLDYVSKLITGFKKDYDVIILDCPPVVGLSDTLILSKYSEANILVITSKKTSFKSLELAKKAFQKAGSTITGVIMNRTSPEEHGYSSYYSAGYYTIDEDINTKGKNKRKSR